MDKKYYIAYGSNLNLFQMSRRCPAARVIGTSAIEDYELLFKGSKTGSYLTIEKNKGSYVPVAIWQITGKDEEQLDRYEGYPTFYYKMDMTLPVRLRSGKIEKLPCFIYIMHEDRRMEVPRRYYVDGCIEGYESFGFDIRLLYTAYAKSKEARYER